MKTDAEIADDISRGQTAAWGEVFDRHRDAVWHVALAITRNRSDAEDVLQATFLKATERFSQLRDPAKLRPWLLSIARSDALDRVRGGRPGGLPDEGLPVHEPDLGSALRRTEITALVQAAFDGLEPRDRLALELTERQNVSRSELADVLGVSTENAYVVHKNARSRFCRSVEAFVVARTGAGACGDLADLLTDWDGTLDPRLRKRLARHIDACPTCESTREREVSPAALLGALPLLAIPTEIAARTRTEVSAASIPPAGEPDATGFDTVANARSAGATGGTAPVGAAASMSKLAIAGIAALFAAGAAVAAAVAVAGSGSDHDAAEQGVPPLGRTAVADQGAPPEDLVVPTAPADQGPTPGRDAGAAASTDDGDNGIVREPSAVTPCELADALREVAEPGPVTGASADVEAYITTVNAALQALARADGSRAITDYATSYQSLVDAEAWSAMPLPDDPDLRAQRDALQAHLTATCPGQ